MRRLCLIAVLLIGLPDRSSAEEITVACWNVENLFDTRKDTSHPGEPVPSDEDLKTKMTKTAQVIKCLKADVVGLVEVENNGVLRRLCREFLKDEGYEYFTLVDETDARGIDVAMISKRPFTAYSFPIPGHTRGVLACRFVAGGEPFYVLVNHWKSRIGGGEDVRQKCAERNLELVTKVIPGYEGRNVPTLVMGDLNDEYTAKTKDKSVEILIQGGLINTFEKTPMPDEQRWTYPWWDSANKKAHYHWFDHILANSELADGKGIDWVKGSARVVRPSYMLIKRRHGGVEYEWVDDSRPGHIGYSDHLPVSITLHTPEAGAGSN